MIRCKDEDPNRPPSRSDPRRARLRVAAEWLKGNTVAVYAINALADDAAATPYELALMTTAACRIGASPTNRNASIAAAVDEVAREVAQPTQLAHCWTYDSDLTLAALATTGLLDDVLAALQLSVVASHGAVVVTSHGRALAAMPEAEWAHKLGLARRGFVACPMCSGEGCSEAARTHDPANRCYGDGRVTIAEAERLRRVAADRNAKR